MIVTEPQKKLHNSRYISNKRRYEEYRQLHFIRDLQIKKLLRES